MISLPEEKSLGENQEYAQAKAMLATLQDEYSAQVVEYTELVGVVKPNLETEYMMTIGKKEHKLFSLHVTYLRLKREIALYQAAKNRGEQIESMQINTILDAEFEEYLRQIEAQQKAVAEAEEHFLAKKMSAEKKEEFKNLYHKLVKKIHPDLHPELPPMATVLWGRIQDTYKTGDLSELILLADMVDELFAGELKKEPVDLNPVKRVQQQYDLLVERLEQLKEQIRILYTQPPLCHLELLNNPQEILKKREELDAQIKQLEETIEMLKKVLKELME